MKNLFQSLNYEKYYKGMLPYIKKEKNQQYLAVILTFGASIFFALFAINPSLSTIAKLNKEISDSRFADQKLSQKINSLSSLSQQYQNIQGDIPFVLNAVPETPQAPTLIAQIQSIAQDASIKLDDIGVSPINLTDNQATVSSSLSFEITAEGPYENIKKFMTGLIGMQRVVSLDYITIAKGITQGNVSLDIKGSAFFKKP